MTLSAFDLYSIGIGPSSSHTVGPMRAAKLFADGLREDEVLSATARVVTELFGSLGLTGRGHGSHKAVILGLEGEDPATVDTDLSDSRADAVRETGKLTLAGSHVIGFDAEADLILHRHTSLPAHPNGMRFTAYDEAGRELRTRTYCSVGGGFVVDDATVGTGRVPAATEVRYPFTSADHLVEENASGGRIVTAPTNGAAGIIPAVLHYYVRLSTTSELTCYPVGGLVQIPCIERNAIASVKAINAARLALNGTGSHTVSLDAAIRTMRETGRDMHVKYKATSRGGLAVNIVEC